MGIVLASASPRRRNLLSGIVNKFTVKAAEIDESIHKGESFSRACVRLAVAKAKAVAAKYREAIVIGADTIAYIGKRNFRKTDNERQAGRVLSFLSGRTHFVVTGVCVIFPSGKCVKYSVKAAVKMKKYGELELASYLKSGEWRGRAGCYDVSGKGRRLVESIRGEREAVVGLPLKKLRKAIRPSRRPKAAAAPGD